jgi:hypothetical protein
MSAQKAGNTSQVIIDLALGTALFHVSEIEEGLLGGEADDEQLQYYPRVAREVRALRTAGRSWPC